MRRIAGVKGKRGGMCVKGRWIGRVVESYPNLGICSFSAKVHKLSFLFQHTSFP